MPESVLMELLSSQTNLAVVRLPGRRFPGTVVQGDSLSILVAHARAIHARASAGDDDELRDEAEDLLELLETRQRHYESVLAEHGIELPYTRSDG